MADLADPTGPRAPHSADQRFYLPQLDGLRFLAALLVYLSHAPALPYLGLVKANGWLGVDLFLCISAFLITRLLDLEFQTYGRVRIGSFFVRRALRIWPLYLGYATLLCSYAFIQGKNATRIILSWWLSHMTFTANVLTAYTGYSPVNFTAHLWTISLEEQAYLIIPFVVSALLLAKVRPKTLMAAAVGGLMLLIGARTSLALGGVKHPFIYVLPLRGDAILLGTVLGLLPRFRLAHADFVFIGCAAIFLTTPMLIGPVESAFKYQTVGYTIVAAAALGLVATTESSGRINRILGSTPMRYLGKISYGLYVFHVVALAFVVAVLNRMAIYDPVAIAVAGLIVTIAISALSYALYEKPFLKLKRRFTRIASRPL